MLQIGTSNCWLEERLCRNRLKPVPYKPNSGLCSREFSMVRSVSGKPNPLPMSACLCLIAPCMSGSRRCTPILGTPLSAWRRTRAGMTEDLRKVYKNVISVATIKYSDQEKIMPIDLPRYHRESQQRHCPCPRPTDCRNHVLSSHGKLELARPEVA